MSGADLVDGAMSLRAAMASSHTDDTPVRTYARDMPCPVLTVRLFLVPQPAYVCPWPCTVLTSCMVQSAYALPGTDGTICLRILTSCMVQSAYEMPGTDVACAPTRMLGREGPYLLCKGYAHHGAGPGTSPSTRRNQFRVTMISEQNVASVRVLVFDFAAICYVRR